MDSHRGFAQIIIVTIIAAMIMGSGILYYQIRKPTSQPQSQRSYQPQTEVRVKTETALEETPKEKPKKESGTEQEIKPKPVTLPSSSKINSSAKMPPPAEDFWKNAIPQAPINLALPLAVADIEEAETVLSPYGIIRKSGDGGIGHGGIDFPLRKGSPLYAVASGIIIKNNLEDPGGGKTVDILIMPGKFPGEGWIFKYDHVNLTLGLKVGDNVEKGQQIGTNAFVERGNNHIGLEYQTRNFTIAREKICWVDLLELASRKQLESAFDRIKKTLAFVQSWQTANEEGYYQYKGLLDMAKYPAGPQLCYRLGTDARISLSSSSASTPSGEKKEMYDDSQKPVLKNLGIKIEPWDKITNKGGDFLFENKNYADDKIFTEFAHKIVNDFGIKLLPEIGFNVPVGTKVMSPIDGVITEVKLYEPSQDYIISLKTDQSSPWIVGFEHIYHVRGKVGDKIWAGQELAEVSPSYGKPAFGNVEVNVWIGGQNIMKYCPFDFLDESLKPMYGGKINQLAKDWEEFIGKDVYKQENWVAPGCLLHEMQEK